MTDKPNDGPAPRPKLEPEVQNKLKAAALKSLSDDNARRQNLDGSHLRCE